MGLIDDALRTLRAVQTSALASPVAYRRSGGAGKTLQAVVGRSVFHSRSDYGTWMRLETRDFIVAAGQLADPPKAGDEIRFNGRAYEVLSPNGEPCWRWSDPHHTALRIHTKLTGEKL